MSASETLSWDNEPSRKTWSEELLKSIQAAKPMLDQANAEAFMEGYANSTALFRSSSGRI